jgi:type II secretory pathway pseudopilin PulG
MRARRGVSLLEAIAALAIVGITAISALATVGAEMKTAERARRAIIVEALATERQSFVGLLTDRDLLNLPDSVAKGQFDPPMDEYKWSTTATPSSSYAGLYDVTVAITWPEGAGIGSYATTASQYRRPVTTTTTRGR